MTQIKDVMKFLSSDNTDGYGPSPIPSPVDDAVRQLLGILSRADEHSVTEALSAMEERHGFVLIGFAERMAALAVRTFKDQYIKDGLAALGLASRLLYYKEAIPPLSLLYRSTQIIGSDAGTAFKKVPFGIGEFQSVAKDFIHRSDQDRSLEAMGYVESRDQDGFRYNRTW